MRFALLSLAVLSLPAAAAEPKQGEETRQEEPAEKKEEQAEEKKICRNVRLDMSSRFTERVCMTKKEWRAFNRNK